MNFGGVFLSDNRCSAVLKISEIEYDSEMYGTAAAFDALGNFFAERSISSMLLFLKLSAVFY